MEPGEFTGIAGRTPADSTPTFDRLATGGLRYSNFHTTALCSPTRVCRLTGRNHHRSGMGRIVEFASGFPGYDATMPKANGFLSEVLNERVTPRSPSASGTCPGARDGDGRAS